MTKAKTIKIYNGADKVYTVKDAVSGTVKAVYMAKNEKDMVRTLAFIGYWKVERWIDTEIYETGMIVESDGSLIKLGDYKKVDLEKVAEELTIQLENDAKPIEATKEELEKAMDNGTLEVVNDDNVKSEETK